MEEDEQAPPDGQENQVQAGTPVTNIGIRASYDSGTKGDNITNNTRPSIEYTKASNGSITARYRKAGGQWAAITQIGRISNTAGSVRTPTLTGGDGDYEVEITQSIPGSTAKATYTFTLDTTAPTAYINNGQFTLNDTPIKIGENGDVSVTLQIGNNFGTSVALSADGTLLAVGASGDFLNKGSVYLFEKSGGSWSQTLKISDNDGGANELDISLSRLDSFGTSVAFSADGTLLAVGASGDSSYKGAVYLFEKSNGVWSQTLKIFDKDGTAGAGELDITLSRFYNFGTGTTLSADGTLLAVGATGDSSGKGAVYLFEKQQNGTWSQTLKISDNNGGSGELDVPLSGGTFGDSFGKSVVTSSDGTILAVGATGDSSRKGAVYLFEKSNGVWSQTLKIFDKVGTAGTGELDITLSTLDLFGNATTISEDGTLLAVGANGTDSYKGAVYIFEKSGGSWSQTLKISDNNGGAGEIDISLQNYYQFGASTSIYTYGNILAIGSSGENSKGTVYLFSGPQAARSFTVSATDNEQSSTWEYTTITDDTCGAAQFATTQTAYTEGSNITFSSESDTGKRVCFKTTDAAGNATVYTLSKPLRTIDRTAPTLSATRIGTGNTRTYRVRAADVSSVTGRTKDNVASSACTTGTTTTGAGWSDYTPGEIVGTAHDTNGRCVIVTDAAGNIAKVHLSDSGTYPDDFTLDMDLSGTFEPNRDAILLYLYTNQGASASELTSFTSNGQQTAVTDAIGRINAVKDQTNTPMDMDGNGTFTANTDGAIPYLHSGQGYDATALVPFTHNRQQTTATNAITRVRGTVTPNWP